MPELPEVETVRQGLIQAVLNRKIKDVEIFQPQLRFPVPVEKLQRDIIGCEIRSIQRRGKYLILELSNNLSIIVHLGMSGRLFVTSHNSKIDKHDHVIISLEGGEHLRFRDPRRFGMIDVYPSDDLENHARLKELGVEPLTSGFEINYCFNKVKNSQRPIKNMLMDASFVVGLGNIYTSEALYKAKIHPGRASNSLIKKHWKLLIASIQSVLKEAISQGGTTLQDEGFKNVLGSGGMFQLKLKVYGKEGEPCEICGHPITRLVQQGRSSFLCKICQR